MTGSVFSACANSTPPMYYEILEGLDKELQMQSCYIIWLNLFNGIGMLDGETRAEI